MIELKLKPNENAYMIVDKLVRKYWECVREEDDVVVNVECSYDGQKWHGENQFGELPGYGDSEVLWLNDWWEGEPYIRIHGIKNLNELDVIGGAEND